MLKRRVSDEVRGVRDVIVMPKEWRSRVLKLAHDRFTEAGLYIAWYTQGSKKICERMPRVSVLDQRWCQKSSHANDASL